MLRESTSMSGKLLDTNAVAALFNEDKTLQNALSGTKLLLPFAVVGELYYGAYKSGQVTRNIERLEKFLTDNEMVNPDAVTAKWYGQIKNELKLKGRPIPENDIWIAAIARQYELTLVTRDAHFNEITALDTESW